MIFWNLPYLFDGDLSFSETGAIMRYIISKYDKTKELVGKTSKDLALCEQMIGVLADIKGMITNICYTTGDAEKIKKNAYPEYEAIVKFMGKNKFLIGDYLTQVDFIFYEMNELMQHCSGGEFYTKFPVLKEYNINFENIEKINNYINSDRYDSKMVFNNKCAKL